MPITRWVASIGAAALLAACGSKGGELDCAWLAGNNCWKTTAAAAASCIPGNTETGTLSSDGRTCTFSGGKTVSFDDPLVIPVPSDKQWKFTVNSNGQQCLRYEDTSTQSLKMTTEAGTVTESGSGFGLSVSCPDRATYSTSNGWALLSCGGDAGLASFPGNSWYYSGNAVSFRILGTQNGSMTIFSCKAM